MAIGGSLRAALKAGNWVRTAMESRRRARALADLNARGGIQGSRQMSSPESRGFIRDGRLDEGYDSFTSSPFGGHVYNHPDGSRLRLSGVGTDYNMPGAELRGRIPSGMPIEAPYEGFRVWNPGNDYFNAPPPFVGRGRPPFPDMPLLEQYGYPGLAPSFNDPYSMNVPLAFRGLANYNFPF